MADCVFNRAWPKWRIVEHLNELIAGDCGFGVLSLTEGTNASPADGDIWATTTDLKAYINGTEYSLVGGLLPTGIDDQMLVNVSGTWTATSLLKFDNVNVLTLDPAASNPTLRLDAPAGFTSDISFLLDGVERGLLRFDASADQFQIQDRSPSNATLLRMDFDALDFNIEKGQIVYIWDSTNTDWLALRHNGTEAYVQSNASNLNLVPQSGSYVSVNDIAGAMFDLWTNANPGSEVHKIRFRSRKNGTDQGADGQVMAYIHGERQTTQATMDLVFGTVHNQTAGSAVETARLHSEGYLEIQPQSGSDAIYINGNDTVIRFNNDVTERVVWFGTKDNAASYATGIETGYLYHKAATGHRWYVNTNADGGTSDEMQLIDDILTLNGQLHISRAGSHLKFYETDATDANDYWMFEANGDNFTIWRRDDSAAEWEQNLRFLADLAGIQASVDLDMQDNDIVQANFDDYSVTHSTATVSANAATCTYSTAHSWFVDLEPATGAVTITLSGGPPSGTYGEMIIRVQQDTTASRTITWAGGTFKWPGGTAPTMTATADAIDVFHFHTIDAGTTWYGHFMQDVK